MSKTEAMLWAKYLKHIESKNKKISIHNAKITAEFKEKDKKDKSPYDEAESFNATKKWWQPKKSVGWMTAYSYYHINDMKWSLRRFQYLPFIHPTTEGFMEWQVKHFKKAKS